MSFKDFFFMLFVSFIGLAAAFVVGLNVYDYSNDWLDVTMPNQKAGWRDDYYYYSGNLDDVFAWVSGFVAFALVFKIGKKLLGFKFANEK